MSRLRALAHLTLTVALVVLPWAGPVSATSVGDMVSSGVWRSADEVETARAASEPATTPPPRTRTASGGTLGSALDWASWGMPSGWRMVQPVTTLGLTTRDGVPISAPAIAPPIFLRNCAFLC